MDLWGLFALLSALCGGVNAVLSKRVASKLDPMRLSLVRTAVVLGIALIAAAWWGDWKAVLQMSLGSVLAIVGAGTATAAAWLCYYRALATGDVNRVTAMDKLSVVLTMLGGGLFMNERIGAVKIATMTLISVGVGITAMTNEVDKLNNVNQHDKLGWIGWSALSVTLVSVSALLSKSGTTAVGAEIALAMRTLVVLAVTIGFLLLGRNREQTTRIDKQTFHTSLLTGAITGVGWIFYFRALISAEAGAVQAVDKLSLWVTMVLSRSFYRRRFRWRELLGATLIIAGIFVLFFNSTS